MIPQNLAGRLFVSFKELRDLGIRHTRVGLNKAITRGDFPPPVRISANRVAWVLEPADDPRSLLAWLASRPSVMPTRPAANADEARARRMAAAEAD